VLSSAGHMAYRQGEYGRAEELLLEAHELLRERKEHATDAITLLMLGDTALVQEQFDQAAARYEESIEKSESTRYSWSLIDALAGLGGVKVCTGNLVEAAVLYSDSLDRAQHQGFAMLVSTSLLGLGAIAAASGQPEAGAHLLGAAEALAGSLEAPLYPRDEPIRARAIDVLVAALGMEGVAATREVGRTLSPERAIAEAAAVARHVTRSPS
jgi:tetratricopeptide (TPR) repeat protein